MNWKLLALLLLFIPSVHAAAMHPMVQHELEANARVEAAILFKEPNLDMQGKRHQLTPHVTGVFSEAELRRLESDPNVLAIEPNRMLYPLLDQTTRVVKARPHVWDLGLTGAGQTVCVVDSGVNYEHPALGGCLGPGCKVIAGYDPNGEFNHLDASLVGHGTHMAGIVASEDSEFTGVAPGASIVAVRVCEPFGGCPEFDVAQGLAWCVNNKDAHGISIISLSLGTDGVHDEGCFPTSVLSMAIQSARNADILVVVASGNDGLQTGVNWPACANGATSVGATDDVDQIASFTNRGPGLDLLAPGVLVTSTSRNWERSANFIELSGTSMSAPHVAGAAAILLEAQDLTADELEQVLIETSTIVDQWPRIDVLAAVQAVETPPGLCASTVESMPAHCNGGAIISDVMNGCRTVICEDTSGSLQVLACDKPSNSNPEFFEMYLQDSTTDGLEVCLGDTCIGSNGFARSPDLPICTGELATLIVEKIVENDDGGGLSVEDFPLFVDGSQVTSGETNTLSPGTYTVSETSTEGYTASFSGDCQPDGTVTLLAGQVKSCTITNNDIAAGLCYESVADVPSTCEGVISLDDMNGCRTLVCESGGRSTQVLACNKPGNHDPQFFEMYRQDVTGEPLQICLGDTCIQHNGFARSADLPLCTGEPPPACTDADDDTFAVEGDACGLVDCNDQRADIFPGANERCNLIDDNCDGIVDEGCDDVSVTLSVAPWFPQGKNYVFVCEPSGFTPVRYDWDFGDNQTQGYSPRPDVWHTFAEAGTYTVWCRGWDSQNIRTDTLVIEVA